MKHRGPLASMAQKGTGTDTMVGHLTPGEVVVPRALTAEDNVMRKLKEAFEANGLNFQQYVVGSDANRPNPHTGAPMFEGGGDPGEGGNNSSEGGQMGAEGGTAHGDGGNTTGGGGQMGAEGGTAHGDGGYSDSTTGGSPAADASGPSNPGGTFGGGFDGPGVSPGDSDPSGQTPGGVMGGGPSLGGGPSTEANTGNEEAPAADRPSPNAMEVSGLLSALGLDGVFGPTATTSPDRNAAVGQIGGGPNATPGIGPGSLNEAAANIAGTSGGAAQAQANANATGDPALAAAVASVLGAMSNAANNESDAANMPSSRANPVSGQLTPAQMAEMGLTPGMNTATVNALGPGAIGTIGGTTALGNAGFGFGGAQGQISGTIGGSVTGGPNDNFGDPGITGIGGAMAAAAEAAAQAAAEAATATGGIAGMAGPDTYGGFDLGGITSNDMTADVSAPFGGRSVGMAPGSVSPSVGMGFGTDKTGISMGAPYAGADVDTGMLGATGVPGSRADARAEQAAQLAAQAAATITGVGTTQQEALANMAAQKAAAQQQAAQQAAQQQAAMQAPAQSPLAAVSSPSFNPAQIAAAIASMGTRPGMTAPSDDEAPSTAPSRAGTATAAPSPSVAGQPSRSASSIAAPEKAGSAFSNAVSSILSPGNLSTVAINTGLGMVNPAVAAALQGASYLGTGQSVGANLTGLASGQGLQAGGLLGAIMGGGPTAGFNVGPSNPNLSPGDGGEGGGGMVAGGGTAGPGGYVAPSTVATGTTGGGSIPSAAGQYQTGFSRTFQGLPSNLAEYGYGPQYSFYAAQGGRVEGPLSKMRRK